jgi:hypothetical protein
MKHAPTGKAWPKICDGFLLHASQAIAVDLSHRASRTSLTLGFIVQKWGKESDSKESVSYKQSTKPSPCSSGNKHRTEKQRRNPLAAHTSQEQIIQTRRKNEGTNQG